MKNKWLIALSAVGIHISIGSVYAWSVLTKPIIAATGFTLAQTTWTFSIAILFLGLSAGFLGSFVEKTGPRKSGYLSMVLFCTGLVGTALALHLHSLILLYIFYGVIGGMGLGIGYITPVSTLVKYFPRAKGFATGLAIMGFGFASLVAGPLMQYLINHFGLIQNFLIIALIYLCVMFVSASYLAPPTTKQTATNTTNNVIIPEVNYTVKEAMGSWTFYALWFIFFINITCGIGLLSLASPMAQEVVHMSPVMAASMVGIMGLVNGLGRIGWSSLSDYLGRKNTYILFFLLQIIAFYALAQVTNAVAFQLLILLIVSCYGGGFSCMPAYLSDLYGVKQLSAIHGRILTAWGLAGIVGPVLLSLVKEITHSYTLCLYVFATLFITSLVVAIVLKVKTSTNKILAPTEG